MMKNLQHPNIVAFKQSFFSEGKRHLCIVMTYCDGGDLEQRLKQQRGKLLREDQVMHWFVQMALGLHFMHEKHVLHRDIKSQNIFMLGNGRLVLGDLGIAKALSQTSELARTKIGTPYYMSPELFENKPYNHKSDIWALGCVLYEMATFKHPFEANSLHALAARIMRGKYASVNAGYSKAMHKLIGDMLKLSPRDRPDLGSILQLPYVKRHVSNFLQDIAARSATPSSMQPIGEGTMLLGNVVAQMAQGQAVGASHLGHHASSLYTQLDALSLSEVVTSAFEAANKHFAPPAAPTTQTNPVSAAQPTASSTSSGGKVDELALQRQVREQRNALSREQEHRRSVHSAIEKLREVKAQQAEERRKIKERAREHMTAIGRGPSGARRSQPSYLRGAAARREAELDARASAAAAQEARREAVAVRKAEIDKQRREAARAWDSSRGGRSHASNMAAKGVGLDAVRAASQAARAPVISQPLGVYGRAAAAPAPGLERASDCKQGGADRLQEGAADDARRLALLGLGSATPAGSSGPGPKVKDPFQRAAARVSGSSGGGMSSKDRVLAAKIAKQEAAQAAYEAQLAAARASNVADQTRAAQAHRAQYQSQGIGLPSHLPVSAAGGAVYPPPREEPMLGDYDESETGREEEGADGDVLDDEEDDVAVQMELASSLHRTSSGKEAEADDGQLPEEEDKVEAAEEEEDMREHEAELQAELQASTMRMHHLKANIRGMAVTLSRPGHAGQAAPALRAVVLADDDADVLEEFEGEAGDPSLDGEDGDFYAVSAAVGVDVLFQAHAPSKSPAELPGLSAFQVGGAVSGEQAVYAQAHPGRLHSGTAHLVSQCESLRENCRQHLGHDGFAAVYHEVQALFLSEEGDEDGRDPLAPLLQMYGQQAISQVQQLVQMEEAIAT
jgi:serine/threonine protein kinase